MVVARRKIEAQIVWENEKNNFGDKLYQSLEYLNFKAHNQDAVKACEMIRGFLSEREKYVLYQKFFPEHWRTSSASFFKPGYFHNHSERANEFFNLVDKNLFPVTPDWADDPENTLDGVAVYGMNFDLCCEDLEWENLRPAYLAGLLFYFRDAELWQFICANFKLKPSSFPKINEKPHPNLWASEQTYERKPYVRLFEIIDHSTGNVWIDTVNCHGIEWFEWTEQNVRMLAEQFDQANKMLESVGEIDDEMQARPARTIKKLISLWNTGNLPGEKNENRKTSGEQTGKRLVDILI